MPGSHLQLCLGYVIDVVNAPQVILNVEPGLKPVDNAIQAKTETLIFFALICHLCQFS